LVIATRVNPNAQHRVTRRIQVRAWNNADRPEESLLTPDGVIEIVSAHLFGLFRGIGLRENALAVALSVQARTRSRDRALFHNFADDIAVVSDRAERELFARSRRPALETDDSEGETVGLETELGPIEIDIAEPIIALARRLRVAVTAEAAANALEDTDSRLDVWERSRRSSDIVDGGVILPCGVELRFPHERDRQ
jgi:hypothetical protein